MRYSSRREAILEVMRSTVSHPTAEWVYGKVRESIPNISLGTVYRNLGALVGDGRLITVETDDGVLHFDADVSPHAHFVCTECGRISDLYGCDDLEDELTRKGYAVDCVKTVVYGRCTHCNCVKH